MPAFVDPNTLPEDGSPVVYEQTFARRLGAQNGQTNVLTDEDVENYEWLIERQEPSGWAAIDKVRGRPYKPHLREMHGEGKFKVTPLDKSGKPIESLHKIELIGNPVTPIRPTQETAPQALQTTQTPEGGDLPIWMRLMLQQQADERAVERERQSRAEERREAWERAQAEKEYLRQERQERLDRDRAEREGEDKRLAAQQRNDLLLAGLGLVKEFAAAKAVAPVQTSDDSMKTVLLQHLLESKQSATSASPQGSMKETLDLLLVLDTLAQRRADSMPAPAEKDDDGLGDTMMKMLPMLMAAKAGGGVAAAPQIDPREMADSLVQQAFRDPNMIAQIAAKNPIETARVFRQAIKNSPELEKAVISVLSEEDEP
jgi:hypothetical protein